jgi:hypothetical protein
MLSLIKIVRGTISATMKPVLCILIPVIALYGSPGENHFWNKKDFRLWSQKECKKLLENSPWSTRYVMSPYVMSPTENRAPFGANETLPIVTYLVQLRSAEPIRKALARQIMISQQHNNLSSEKKQQMEDDIRDLLSGKPLDKVVFHIKATVSATRLGMADVELAEYWLRQTTEQLKKSVFLMVDNGEKIPIERFVPRKDISQLQNEGRKKNYLSVLRNSIEFDFIFPRQIGSKDILTAGDKTLKLEFLHPLVGNPSEGLDTVFGLIHPRGCVVTFNVDRMKVDGKIFFRRETQRRMSFPVLLR